MVVDYRDWLDLYGELDIDGSERRQGTKMPQGLDNVGLSAHNTDMNTTDRRANQTAETHVRLQCSKSHWNLVRLVLTKDLRSQVVAVGQTCSKCKEVLS